MRFAYKPYVPVAERRRQADKKMAVLKKKGQAIEPVTAATPRGKTAASFWGQSWCEHLESYSDFANRLPRGRTYLRNGSVCHLGIAAGRIDALVMGSELYKQSIHITPLPKTKWEALKKRCQGKIGSIVELLQGKLSGEIMRVVTDRKNGLFPGPGEIKLDCSCPDWASLCKHLAAVLYGVGARLDDAPELLFKLRGVDHNELIEADTAALTQGSGTRRRLAPGALGDVFGIDLDGDDAPDSTPPKAPPRKAKTRAAKKATNRRTLKKAPVKKAAKQTNPRKNTATKKAPTQKTPTKKTATKKAPTRKTATQKTAQKKAAPFHPTGAAVRHLRNTLGLNRSAFARKLGVSPPTVANWEIAKGAIRPQPRSLAALRRLHNNCHSG